ncbi:hypothetical protein GCM10020216_016890 [Nonomuraea helvata]
MLSPNPIMRAVKAWRPVRLPIAAWRSIDKEGRYVHETSVLPTHKSGGGRADGRHGSLSPGVRVGFHLPG